MKRTLIAAIGVLLAAAPAFAGDPMYTGNIPKCNHNPCS